MCSLQLGTNKCLELCLSSINWSTLCISWLLDPPQSIGFRPRRIYDTCPTRPIFNLQINEHEKSMIEKEKLGFAKKSVCKGKPPLVVGVTNRHRREIEHESSSSIPSRALVTGGCVCVAVRRTSPRTETRSGVFFREDASSQWCGKFEGCRFERSMRYAPIYSIWLQITDLNSDIDRISR